MYGGNQLGLGEMLRHTLPQLEFEFLGFRGKGLELQQQGWDFTYSRLDREDFYNEICFFMTHDSIGLMGYSEMLDPRTMIPNNTKLYGVQGSQVIPIRQITSGKTNTIVRPVNMRSSLGLLHMDNLEHSPIDFKETLYKEVSLDDLMRGVPFATVNLKDSKEVFIESAQEKELFDIILSKQSAKQTEIRENIRRRNYMKNKEIGPAESKLILKIV